ncbi:MAG: ComEC family competence protein [Sphaerobacteraceae bacterium]|nr:MAG: ComEC family competence protein [Sphaerobacteraceae bacterium]
MRLPLGFLGAGAFVAGIALQSTPYFLPILTLAVGAGLVAAISEWNWRPLALTGALILLALVGVLRAGGHDSYPQGPPQLSETETFSGIVIDVPRVYPTRSFSRVDITEPAESRVWVEFPAYPAIEQGDLVDVHGVFTPNEQTSYRGFAAQRDTTGVLTVERVSIGENQATGAQRLRSDIAGSMSRTLRERIPDPAGAFATGVVLGDDGAMTEATRDSFRVGGLTHMTAVSGVHVGIVAAGLMLVSNLGLVNKWVMLAVSLPVVWSFAYLVGMRPSVVRASIMLTLLVIAHFLGRPRDTLNAVGLAAASMLAWDPAFRHDIGFQLSVAATCGIAIGVLLIGGRSHWHLLWVVPTSAQLATEPLVLYHFGYYSLVSPFANILATPFLAFAMALSLLTILAGMVSSGLADILALAAWVPAMAVVVIADFVSQIPYLSDDVSPLSRAGVWSAYAILGGLVTIAFLLIEPAPEDQHPDYSVVYRV